MERGGICYGVNSRYALITTDTIYIKNNARYKAFLDSYDEAIGPILGFIPTIDEPNNVAKTLGAVGLAVAIGGASLAAQKLYDDNKLLAEKNAPALPVRSMALYRKCDGGVCGVNILSSNKLLDSHRSSRVSFS